MAKSYPNRSDLRGGKVAAKTVPGQTYGKATEQMQAQRAVPMAAPPTDQPPTPVQTQQPQVAPGQVTDLTAPTQRPDEPITAGARFGAGPGTEVFNGFPPVNPTSTNPFVQEGSKYDLLDQVKYAYSKYPNPALMQLMMELESDL